MIDVRKLTPRQLKFQMHIWGRDVERYYRKRGAPMSHWPRARQVAHEQYEGLRALGLKSVAGEIAFGFRWIGPRQIPATV